MTNDANRPATPPNPPRTTPLARPQQPGLAIQADHIDELWDRMCAIYGRPRWEKSYGEYDATGDWGRALADITTAELARGFEACAKRGDDWMPSAGQFRALCRPPPVSKRPDEREAQYEVCEDCRRRLPYFGYKQSHQGQDRIIGRSATMGFLCNICVPLQPLPYSDRKLPTKSV